MNAGGPHPKGEKLLALIEGELSQAETDALEEHCRACASCRRLRDELSAVRDSLQAEAPAGPLRPIWPAVRERRAAVQPPLLRPAFAAATGAAVIAGVFLGMVVGTLRDRPVETGNAYLWTEIGSTVVGEGGDTLPDIYTSPASGDED
ncbi:MAG: hypothetical protein GF355_10040 [Candidatus Eisenbacteria bacterium]|nr:hypothetical protein [Candidatus Eisenbacteria bacterium]